jgi:hypothetical protein
MPDTHRDVEKELDKLGANGSHLQSQLLRRQRSGGSRFKVSLKQIVHKTPSQKNLKHRKRAGGVAQGVGPESKPQCHQKNKMT